MPNRAVQSLRRRVRWRTVLSTLPFLAFTLVGAAIGFASQNIVLLGLWSAGGIAVGAAIIVATSIEPSE